MSIGVWNESGVAVDELALLHVARHALDRLGVSPLAELSLLLVDVERMEELHVRWMDEPGPTDVLAFPMDLPGETSPGEPAILGDVVLCPDVAAEQAGDHATTADAELELLLVHGILHLLGHDHAEPDERDRMFALTDRLLGDFRRGGAAEGAADGAAPDGAAAGASGVGP